MNSPLLAIGWEIWSRNRHGLFAVSALIGSASVINWLFLANNRWSGLAEAAGYVLLVLALCVTFGCFHFTEGQRKGGFGSFPHRLFHIPVATYQLVAFPMIFGCMAVLTVYVAGSWLLFGPLGKNPAILWPSLYLLCGFTQFQMIVWSFPESRYLKLLCLSFAAAVIAFGWMFFLPHVIEGTLVEWGYEGSPALFKRYLLVGLALTGPAAFGVSLHRVRQQRHGKSILRRPISRLSDWISIRIRPRRKPFRSAMHGVFWHEWRQTGFILPIGVAAILAMTCVPSYLTGPLSGRATVGVLGWIFASPILLAVIIGRGFSKPDFWSQDLNVTPFNAIRPLTSGQWVLTKMKVAMGSVALTWGMVWSVSFIWVAQAGDFAGLEQLFRQLKLYYSPQERWALLVLACFAAIILTWRLMVSGLAVGMSGRKYWYRAANLLTAALWGTLLVLILWRSDHSDPDLRLYDLRQWIPQLTSVLGLALIAKVSLASWVWHEVYRREILSRRCIYAYFGWWLLATGALAGLAAITLRDTAWLRLLLVLLSMLLVPLVRPGLAMWTLAKNRSGT